MFAGRRLRLRTGTAANTAIAEATSTSFTINREPINVTTKGNNGVQQLLAEHGTHAIEVSMEGILVDDTLLMLAGVADSTPSAHALATFNIDVAGQGTFAGSWFISSFEASGAEGAEAVTFSMTIMSASEITYTSA